MEKLIAGEDMNGLVYIGSDGKVYNETSFSFQKKKPILNMEFLTKNKKYFICIGSFLGWFAIITLVGSFSYVPPLAGVVWLTFGKFEKE